MHISPAQRRAAIRIKALREQQDRKQDELAKAMGLGTRQALDHIESLTRPISSRDLAAAAKALSVPTQTLLDPFILVGEGEFNFRAADADAEAVDAFSIRAGRWVATYRELSIAGGERHERVGLDLRLTERSSFEDAATAADELRVRLKLGAVPAKRLERAIEEDLGIALLYVDAPSGISGAAVHLEDFQAILVNRHEVQGRRSFDLAHELFHVLTWYRMKPATLDPIEPRRTKGNRVEQLADNFAAALLMPREVMDARWTTRGDMPLAAFAVRTAHELLVSPQAVLWRLVALDTIKKAEASRTLSVLGGIHRPSGATSVPPLFSKRFIHWLHDAVETGRLSVLRASEILGISLVQFAALCQDYKRPLAYDFQTPA